jgi:hypothetical protein
MAEHGAVFKNVDECLYVIRDHRAYFRLTTHLPRSVHAREIRRILRKHGLGRIKVERFVFVARRGYLRQCLYRSRADRWLKERMGVGRPRVWRDPHEADRIHLAEVGLTWPPDSFLRDKLAGLAARGMLVTVLATPGSSWTELLPGVEVRIMRELRPPVWRGTRTALRDGLRFCRSNPGSIPRFVRTVWRAARGRGPRTWLGWISVLATEGDVFPDICHFEWESSAVKYLALNDFWDSPMTMSCHGGLDLYASSPTHAAAIAGLREAFARATAVHCVSEAILDEATRHGLNPAIARVIRPGVDVDLFSPDDASIGARSAA